MLDSVTLEAFQPYVDTTFTLYLDADTPLACELVDLKSFGKRAEERGWGIPENTTPRTETFSAVFRTPHEPVLAQAMYTVTHPEFGTLEGLFLVPVAMDEHGRYYEAVFN